MKHKLSIKRNAEGTKVFYRYVKQEVKPYTLRLLLNARYGKTGFIGGKITR